MWMAVDVSTNKLIFNFFVFNVSRTKKKKRKKKDSVPFRVQSNDKKAFGVTCSSSNTLGSIFYDMSRL